MNLCWFQVCHPSIHQHLHHHLKDIQVSSVDVGNTFVLCLVKSTRTNQYVSEELGPTTQTVVSNLLPTSKNIYSTVMLNIHQHIHIFFLNTYVQKDKDSYQSHRLSENFCWSHIITRQKPVQTCTLNTTIGLILKLNV